MLVKQRKPGRNLSVRCQAKVAACLTTARTQPVMNVGGQGICLRNPTGITAAHRVAGKDGLRMLIDWIARGWLVVLSAAMFVGVWSSDAELTYPAWSRGVAAITVSAVLFVVLR